MTRGSRADLRATEKAKSDAQNCGGPRGLTEKPVRRVRWLPPIRAYARGR
jgi:hypothetical protein